MARPRPIEPLRARLHGVVRARACEALRGRPRFHYACLCVWPVSIEPQRG